MSVRVGINGFGRIGRNIMRAALGDRNIDFVAINDLTSAHTLAHLLKYDSVLGNLHAKVEAKEDTIAVDGDEFKVLQLRDPAQLPWKDLGVDVVFESTGLFTNRDAAAKHIAAGAKKVVITAPAKGPDFSVVLGVNDELYDPAKHHIISNASCTTNGLAPVAKVLNDEFVIKKGFLTTVHSYTNSQRTLDTAAKEPRDARAAAENIVPSETGAAKAVALVIPDLKGKFGGMAFRVPTSTVSVVDFVATLGREVTKDEINAAFKRASEGTLKGIMGYTEEPLVSSDLKGDDRSTIVSAIDTIVLGDMVKVIAWYDNEWGYACRLADITAFVVSKMRVPAAAGSR